MKNIIGLGEILWDMLPSGKVPGSAPANFACHVSQFGLNGYAVSTIGNDLLGKEILDSLAEKHLNFLIENVDSQTGTVQVTLDETGVPQYEICEGVAWDNIHSRQVNQKKQTYIQSNQMNRIYSKTTVYPCFYDTRIISSARYFSMATVRYNISRMERRLFNFYIIYFQPVTKRHSLKPSTCKQQFDLYESQTELYLSEMQKLCDEHFREALSNLTALPEMSQLSAMIIPDFDNATL